MMSTEGYGMTETTATTHMGPVGKQKLGSIGFPLPGTISAILDPDEDKYLPAGEMGEIVSMGPMESISMSRLSGPLPLDQSLLVVASHLIFFLETQPHHQLYYIYNQITSIFLLF